MFDTKLIKFRLIFIIGLLSVLLVGIGGLGLFGINQSNNGLQSVYEDRAVPLINMAAINDKWQLIRLDAVIAANSGDTAIAKARMMNSANLRKEIQQLWLPYETAEFSAEEKLLVETYNKQVAAYEQTRARTMRMAITGNFEGAVENARNDAAVKFNALHDTLFNLVQLQGNIANEEFSQAQSRYHTIFVISLAAILIGVALAGYFGHLLLRAIMGPLDELNVRAKITDMTCIVSESDLRGNILSANKKYMEVSQYTRDELIGQPHSITRHPDMPKATFKKLWSTIGRGGTFRGIIKNRAKDGTPYFVDATIAPVMGANGKPKKYIGVRYDITEAEIERQNMKGIFDAINAFYAYVEFNVEGNVLTANENFLQLMGYQSDEVVGKHHRTFVEAGFANSSEYSRFWEDLRAGQSHTGTFKRFTKSGQGVWIQATYSPVKDEMGRVVKVMKIATDVTREKLEVEGQLEAISRTQAVIEFSMDGKIVAVNDNFHKMFGYTCSEVTGQHHNMLLDTSVENSAENRALWEKLCRGESAAGQHQYVGKNGKTIWIQAFYNPLTDLSNKPFKVVMYATDITQQTTAAKMLQSAVKQTKTVIAAAKDGDLAQRVPLEGKTGDIAELCTNVNSLVEMTEVIMNEVGRVLAALAKGDLKEKITNNYHGAFGKLKDNVNQTVDNLVKIVGSISESADVIAIAVKEIASGNSDLSERTEKQAANLEETAASIEELTSTVRQNADNAQQANQLAIGASNVADKGGDIVNQVVTSMSSINDSSKKIVDIIGVIDGIAFQTNILALNAAVEAARAGEQGRGFAVVATEVRNLAQRSSAAAKEIKSLISDSVEEVESGARLVDEAGATMNEIVQSIKHVTDIMGEITAASREQSSGIEQVNDAISQIDEGTQQNAALVEQAAAAAEEMQTQVQQLSDAVAAFSTSKKSPEVSVNKPAYMVERRDLKTRPFSGRPMPHENLAADDFKAQKTAIGHRSEKKAAAAAADDEWGEF